LANLPLRKKSGIKFEKVLFRKRKRRTIFLKLTARRFYFIN